MSTHYTPTRYGKWRVNADGKLVDETHAMTDATNDGAAQDSGSESESSAQSPDPEAAAGRKQRSK